MSHDLPTPPVDVFGAVWERNLQPAFIGYAVMDISEQVDQGRGPRLELAPFGDRTAHKETCRAISEAYRSRRWNSMHANSFLLVGVHRDALNVASLASDPALLNHTSVVQWTPLACSQEMSLLNGYQRVYSAKTYRHSLIHAAATERAVGNRGDAVVARHVSSFSEWGVKLFDLGTYCVLSRVSSRS